MSNKILLEAGGGEYRARWGGWKAKEDPYTGNLVKMVEQCTAGCAGNGSIPGLIYRSQSNDLFVSGRNLNHIIMWRGSFSYVTGAHSFKAGYMANRLSDLREANRAPNGLDYRVNNGVPNQLTMWINNYQQDVYMRGDGYYAQEQWTLKRLTLQGAIRYDRAWSWAPEQTEGPAQFLPTPISFPRTPIASTPSTTSRRASAAAYDLFGDGKTALKTTFGRYLEAALTAGTYTRGNPTSRIIQSVNRAWTDANSNFRPDCNLLDPNAQDLRATGGDFCGAFSNRNFGTTTFSNTIDPDILKGWGVRPSDWNLGVSIQREVLPRTSVEVGYFWRWFQGFAVTDNLAVSPADFDSFSVDRAVRPATAGRRRLHRVGPLQRQARVLRPDQQLHHLLGQVRRPVRQIQRPGHHRQRAADARSHHPGRLQRRADHGGQLRGEGEAAGDLAARPVLPRRDGVSPALQVVRLLQRAQDRRPVRPDVHEQAGPAGELCRHADRQRRHAASQLHRVQRHRRSSRSAGRSPATPPTSPST